MKKSKKNKGFNIDLILKKIDRMLWKFERETNKTKESFYIRELKKDNAMKRKNKSEKQLNIINTPELKKSVKKGLTVAKLPKDQNKLNKR